MDTSLRCNRRVFVAMASSAALRPRVAWSSADSPIQIQLAVTGAQGRPVPHATIWASVLPRSSPLALDTADLRRIATRYRETMDVATPYNVIVPEQLVLPMADSHGRASLSIDYRSLEGSGAHRPPRTKIALAVLDRGHEPAFVEFDVGSQDSLSATVALTRNVARKCPRG